MQHMVDRHKPSNDNEIVEVDVQDQTMLLSLRRAALVLSVTCWKIRC